MIKQPFQILASPAFRIHKVGSLLSQGNQRVTDATAASGNSQVNLDQWLGYRAFLEIAQHIYLTCDLFVRMR